MRTFAEIAKKHPGAYNPRALQVVKEDLEKWLGDADIDCGTAIEPYAIYRAQGARDILRQLVEVMANGADAPAAVAGISTVT